MTSCPGVSGSVCVITGAGSGIGAAVARCMAEHAARVAVVDCNLAGAEAVANEIRVGGGEALALKLDVCHVGDAEHTSEEIESNLGPIGVLVNNAGIIRTGPVTSFNVADWEAIFAVNATGVFVLSRAVARRMIPRGKGSIITIGSNCTGVIREDMAAYAAAKAAATVFTKCLGLELAKFGIRCNVVCPGSTDTPMQRALWQNADGERSVIEGSLGTHRVGVPLRRLAQPEDIASAVLFLASEQARHITMQDLHVDGGASLRA